MLTQPPYRVHLPLLWGHDSHRDTVLTHRALKRLACAVAATAVVGLTSGCLSQAAQDPQYTDLSSESSARDTPVELPDYALESFDLETIRWVGEREGTELWLAEGSDPFTVCLLAYPNETEWVSGCGGRGGGTSLSGSDGRTYVIVADGATAPSNATPISTNVYTTD
jgi:hypothetical protein